MSKAASAGDVKRQEFAQRKKLDKRISRAAKLRDSRSVRQGVQVHCKEGLFIEGRTKPAPSDQGDGWGDL